LCQRMARLDSLPWLCYKGMGMGRNPVRETG